MAQVVYHDNIVNISRSCLPSCVQLDFALPEPEPVGPESDDLALESSPR